MRRALSARTLGTLSKRLRSAASRLANAFARRERLWLGLCLAAVGLVLISFLAIHLALARGLVPRWVNTDPEEFSNRRRRGSRVSFASMA